MFTGSPCRAPAASTRLMPGSAGSSDTSRVIMMRIPTVPGVAAQSATVSATAGSEGSTGLINANRPGYLLRTSIA